jgi:hypothetical protein
VDYHSEPHPGIFARSLTGKLSRSHFSFLVRLSPISNRHSGFSLHSCACVRLVHVSFLFLTIFCSPRMGWMEERNKKNAIMRANSVVEAGFGLRFEILFVFCVRLGLCVLAGPRHSLVCVFMFRCDSNSRFLRFYNGNCPLRVRHRPKAGVRWNSDWHFSGR